MKEIEESIEFGTRRNFEEFLTSGHTARVYQDGQLVFFSEKSRLLPLLDYLDEFSPPSKNAVVIFDKVVGNSAALLTIVAGCSQVYSPLGSELAIDTLSDRGVRYHFLETVPYIKKQDGEGMCPMEELSLGKTPAEFHEALKKPREIGKCNLAGD